MPRLSIIKKRRWSSEEIALLGKVSDRRLAERIGIPVLFVMRMRKQLKIKHWQPPKPTKRFIKSQQAMNSQLVALIGVWSEQNLDLLGTLPDEELAALLEVDVKEVRFERIVRQIPLYHYEHVSGGNGATLHD
jgi:hypothetical protein